VLDHLSGLVDLLRSMNETLRSMVAATDPSQGGVGVTQRGAIAASLQAWGLSPQHEGGHRQGEELPAPW